MRTGADRMENREEILKIENLKKSFGKTEVLKGIDMTVYKNEIISVLGPSGCGKSTLLNIIAGMLMPDGGSVSVRGEKISEKGKALPPEKRRMNMVFQDFALWPHMNAYENIAYGLRRAKEKDGGIRERVDELLALLHLEGLEKRYPAELSGGQQQRVAIGRALITRPALILADEPTGNLDTQNTSEVIALLKEASRLYEQTIVMITHSQSIAQTADHILRVSDGVVDDFGRCRE